MINFRYPSESKQQMKFYTPYFVFSFFFFLLLLGSCKKDEYSSSSSDKLSFSTDTLFIDTVFTTLGSSTRNFLIYNNNSKNIKVKNVRLGGGSASAFRLNINGKAGASVSDLVVRAHDSIWVFAEVTINPNSSSTPFVVADSLLFEFNGNVQKVQLRAWGQNAVFHKPAAGKSSFKIDCNSVWDNSLPHVVYGTAEIDTNCTLEIQAGAKVYFYNNGAISALKGSSLKISGTKNNPVTMEGSRLEPWYDNVAGQWLGIYLNNESTGHKIEWLELKNSQVGIFGEGMGSVPGTEFLNISNTKIQNCTKEGLYVKESKIKAWNLVVVNCGSSALKIERGGAYDFTHCTFANYLSFGTGSKSAAVAISNSEYQETGTVTADLSTCNFSSSIIYGSQTDELLLSNNSEVFNYLFTNCLLKVSSSMDITTSNFSSCLKNENPSFKNSTEFDFNLKEDSKAINKALLSLVNANLSELEMDLNSNSRILDSAPDIGAYEYKVE